MAHNPSRGNKDPSTPSFTCSIDIPSTSRLEEGPSPSSSNLIRFAPIRVGSYGYLAILNNHESNDEDEEPPHPISLLNICRGHLLHHPSSSKSHLRISIEELRTLAISRESCMVAPITCIDSYSPSSLATPHTSSSLVENKDEEASISHDIRGFFFTHPRSLQTIWSSGSTTMSWLLSLHFIPCHLSVRLSII